MLVIPKHYILTILLIPLHKLLMLLLKWCTGGAVRPPERVKKRNFMKRTKPPAFLIKIIFLMSILSAVSASGDKVSQINLEVEVSRTVTLTIPEEISGVIAWRIYFTPIGRRSVMPTLCSSKNDKLMTKNLDEHLLQGISCLSNGALISSVRNGHAGTYFLTIVCNGSDLPLELNFNLTVTKTFTEKEKITAMPSPSMDAVRPLTVKTGDEGSSHTNTILIVVLVIVAASTLVVTILLLYKRKAFPFSYLEIMKKNNSSADKDAEAIKGQLIEKKDLSREGVSHELCVV